MAMARPYFDRLLAPRGGHLGKRLLERGRARRWDPIHAGVPSTRGTCIRGGEH